MPEAKRHLYILRLRSLAAAMQRVPVFLINLDRSRERLERMAYRLDHVGLEWTRIPAIDGAEALRAGCPDYDPAGAIRAGGRALRPGEVGCYLSHLEAARQVAASGCTWGLVLEDDANLSADMALRLDALIGDLPDTVDLVNLSRRPRHRISPLSPRIGLVQAHYFPVTTTALLWRADAARAFCTAGRPIRLPVDLFLQEFMTQSGRGAAYLLPPVPPDDSQSVIYTGRRSGGVPHRARYHLKRLARLLRNRWNMIRTSA